MASSASRGCLIAAVSVGSVEALKDQGGVMCRWNYAIKSWHQHAKNNMGSSSQAKRRFSSSSSSSAIDRSRQGRRAEKARECEEELLRKVMYLSCWGPY